MLSLTHRLSQTFLALGLAAGAVFSGISAAQAQEFVSIKTATAHVRETDCDASIDLVRHSPRVLDSDAVMSNSFAFGGTNVVLVARRA